MAETFDVVVIGAGPAGSVAAQYAAEAGLSVAIIERRTRVGEPVQCGEFVPGVEETKAIFDKCGDIDEMFNVPSSIISKHTDEIIVHSPKDKLYKVPFIGFSVERKDFDKFLAIRAEKAGAKLFTSTHARGLKNDTVITTKGEFKGKVIVGADGPLARVGSWVGLDGPTLLAPCILEELPGDFEPKLHIYLGRWAPGGYAWIIPKAKSANIGLGIQHNYTEQSLRKLFKKYLEHLGLGDKKPIFKSGGLVPMSGIVKKTVSKNVIMVGDAAGMVMSSNGGGIVPAMLAGKIAADSITAHIKKGTPLDKYEPTWRAGMSKPLKNAQKTQRVADKFFKSDTQFDLSLSIVGRRGLERGIKCRPLFGI
ncbi:MAG: NAD(P)/FAD-dependent oxidoreductase [Thermoplasmata archaeon]|nr:MAG: NAD(P)/FAD-dependent oxidoreductase [Thermoplasmata archaeon]